MMEPFYLTVKHDGKNRKLRVEELLNDGTHEQYDFIGRDRRVTVQSNRPYLRRLGLKRKRPRWVVVEGKVLLPGLLEKFIEELMKIIDK